VKPDKTVNLADYITADEAGKIAGLTGRRIRQLLTGNPPEIKGIQWAGRWMVNKESLYAYLDKEGR
jgi:hypothetical protein